MAISRPSSTFLFRAEVLQAWESLTLLVDGCLCMIERAGLPKLQMTIPQEARLEIPIESLIIDHPLPTKSAGKRPFMPETYPIKAIAAHPRPVQRQDSRAGKGQPEPSSKVTATSGKSGKRLVPAADVPSKVASLNPYYLDSIIIANPFLSRSQGRGKIHACYWKLIFCFQQLLTTIVLAIDTVYQCLYLSFGFCSQKLITMISLTILLRVTSAILTDVCMQKRAKYRSKSRPSKKEKDPNFEPSPAHARSQPSVKLKSSAAKTPPSKILKLQTQKSVCFCFIPQQPYASETEKPS